VQPPVCLVVPPSAFLLDERVFMSLGILRVAAALEQRGVAVELLDLSGVQNFAEVAAHHARESGARHFGVTATTPQMPAATQIARAIRAARNDATVVLGGPHATLTNAACKKGSERARRAMDRLLSEFDVIVAGDGEFSVFRALSDGAPSIVDADDPESPLFLTSRGLSELPAPARHLIDVDSYRYEVEGRRATSLIAQLGCPFGCGFCAGRDSPFLRRVRTRTTESVVLELETLYREYGFTGFMFYDDELNVNKALPELMNAVAAAQERLGTDWRLRGFVKSELLTDAQAEAMYRAGFRWLLVGFESGSERILRNINKRATREDNTRCVEIARRHGLKVKALMSLGHPGESRETVSASRDWLLAAAPDDFDVTIITPYPGSPYYDRALRHGEHWVYEVGGDRLYQTELDYTATADYYKGAPDGGYVSYVHTDDLSSEDLVDLRDDTESQVRRALGIPFNRSAVELSVEHSMGQTLPPSVLRVSKEQYS
jgi:anaerobic magnesium-protoporphyrin IX monomethyl ester cyclase